MYELYIPIHNDDDLTPTYARMYREMRKLGFYLARGRFLQRKDGTITAIIPVVMFTDLPGDPGSSTAPGRIEDRARAYRALAKAMGLPGVYPRRATWLLKQWGFKK